VQPEGLQPQWEQRAEDVGLTRRSLKQVLGRSRTNYRPLTSALADELFGPEGLTRDASRFTVREVIQALCERRGPGVSAAQIENEANELLESDLVVRLSAAKSDFLLTSTSLRLGNGQVVPSVNDATRYSTKEMLRLEERLIRRAFDRQDDAVAVADKAALRDAVTGRRSFSREQRRMVEDLTCSGRGVEVVVGKAGTGKTFALDAARRVWESSGVKVIGCALSAPAAKEAGSWVRFRELHDRRLFERNRLLDCPPLSSARRTRTEQLISTVLGDYLSESTALTTQASRVRDQARCAK
jgi:hypothetical protein